jgi:hypothetical protein
MAHYPPTTANTIADHLATLDEPDRAVVLQALTERYCQGCGFPPDECDCGYVRPDRKTVIVQRATPLPWATFAGRLGWLSYQIKTLEDTREELQRRLGTKIACPEFDRLLDLFRREANERVLMDLSREVASLWLQLAALGTDCSRY